MTQAQAKHLAQRVADLYPGQLTKGTKAELVRRFADLPVRLVEDSIGAYFDRTQEEAKRLKLPELFETIEDAKSKQITEKGRPAKLSWCDIRRQQDKSLAKDGDHVVILRVHWREWNKSGKTDADRRRIESQAVSTMVSELHMTPQAAQAEATVIFADEDTLGLRINELRGNLVPAS